MTWCGLVQMPTNLATSTLMPVSGPDFADHLSATDSPVSRPPPGNDHKS
jgi:hypothetical protein